MKFSIVVPSFNQGKYVGACLDSILAQKGDFEVQCLVLDNNSSDDSWRVILERVARAGKIQIKALQAADRGQSDAVNQGLSQCDGDVLSFLNSDDVLEAGALEKVARVFSKHTEVDFVYGKAHFINEQGKLVGDYHTYDFKEYSLSSHCMISQPATFFRRQAFQKTGPFNTKIQNSFDYEYWLRALSKGLKFYYLHEFLASTRLHEETKSFKNREQIHLENFLIQLKYCSGISNEILHQYLLETSPLQALFKSIGQESSQLAIFFRRVESRLRRAGIQKRVAQQLTEYFKELS